MELSLRPFECHKALMERSRPALEYNGDFKRWREKARRKLSSILGLDAMMKQARPALDAKTLWTREHKLGRIEKVAFSSEPGSDIVAYLCLPKRAKPPYPFFICLQGHSTGMHNSIAVAFKDEERAIVVEGDRDFGLVCMRYGVAALCVEQRGFGEREDLFKEMPRCQGAATRALMLGRTLLGERVYDVDRAIDYLLSRGDADPKRLGVMGNSGGGTVSLYAGALLPRITHLMPSCAFSSYKASIMSIEHCVCNYAPGLLNFFESGDVAALSAPKPLVVVSGLSDTIFPLAEAKAELLRVKRAYADAGAPENCRHVIGAEGHRFYAADAWPVMLELMK